MSDVQWFIQIEAGKKAGPVSFEKLRQLAVEKRIFPDTKIRSTEDGAVWTSAKEFDGLFDEAQTFPESTQRQENVDTPSVNQDKESDKSKGSAIVIDVSGGQSKSKPADKSSAFVIDVKGSSKKNKKESEKEDVKEDKPPKSDAAPGNLKISLPGQAAQKTKEPSAAVQIKIGSKPNPEAPKEKPKSKDESTSITVSLDALNAKKKSAASSTMVKVDLGARKKIEEIDDDSVDDSIAEKKSSKKEKKESVSKSKKQKPKKEKSNQPKEVVLLKSAAIASVLLGLGALATFAVPETLTTILFACLATALGIVAGAAIWLIAPLFNQIQELKEQIEKLSSAAISGTENQTDFEEDEDEE